MMQKGCVLQSIEPNRLRLFKGKKGWLWTGCLNSTHVCQQSSRRILAHLNNAAMSKLGAFCLHCRTWLGHLASLELHRCPDVCDCAI
jgi:hypothetical protein